MSTSYLLSQLARYRMPYPHIIEMMHAGRRPRSPPAPSHPPYDWNLQDRTIRPSFSYVDRLNSSLFDNSQDDFVIRFIFAPRYDAPEVLIHQSRLLFAGGPFEALAKEGFREHAQRRVDLAECDNPQTFAVIRQFLYAKPINMSDASFEFILDAIQSSHRWGLMSLYHVLFQYILKLDLVNSVNDVLAVANIMNMPEVPSSFMYYFWDSVGRQFHKFAKEQAKEVEQRDENAGYREHEDDSLPVEARLCPKFPGLWGMAVSQDMAEYALKAILRFSEVQTRRLSEGLLDVILEFLEPRIKDDAVVCNLISHLNLQNGEYCSTLLEKATTDQVLSARAIRLMTKTLFKFSPARSTFRANMEASRRLSSDNRISTHLRLRALKRSRSRTRMFSPELDSDLDPDFLP